LAGSSEGVAIVPDIADLSYYQASANQELDAACRSTDAEETELHLRLALLHLQHQRVARHLTGNIPIASQAKRDRAICHTDKEA